MVAVIAVVVVMLVMSRGGGGASGGGSLLEIIPEDTTLLAIWDIQAILSAEDALEDFGGFEIRHWGALANVDEDIIEIGNLELDTSQIEQYAFAVDAEEGWGFVVVKGSFFFDDIRDELEDAGFEEDSYRKYEFWTGSEHYALLEDDGYIISSGEEDAVKGLLNSIYQDADSLEGVDGGDLKLILDKLGGGGFVIAVAADSDFDWGCAIRRCQGYGFALTGYDVSEEQAHAKFVALFSSERSAETAADEYDELVDFAESVQRNGFFDFVGDVDVEDAISDGEFVTGTANISP